MHLFSRIKPGVTQFGLQSWKRRWIPYATLSTPLSEKFSRGELNVLRKIEAVAEFSALSSQLLLNALALIINHRVT